MYSLLNCVLTSTHARLFGWLYIILTGAYWLPAANGPPAATALTPEQRPASVRLDRLNAHLSHPIPACTAPPPSVPASSSRSETLLTLLHHPHPSIGFLAFCASSHPISCTHHPQTNKPKIKTYLLILGRSPLV